MAMDFLAPYEPKQVDSTVPKWKLLIVDDDPDVHEVTKIAVSGCEYEGRSFELLHALSAEEARYLLEDHDDIAVALIDVVMESDTAGLGLVRWIRDSLENKFTRLILRTGQPGYAPQTDVIMKYDIDGYTEKAELSRTKLLTAIVTALRGYKLVMSLEDKRKKLKQLNAHFAAIVQRNAISDFATEVLDQFADLVDLPMDSLLCGVDPLRDDYIDEKNDIRVLAAKGALEDKIDLPIDVIANADIRNTIKNCVKTRTICSNHQGTALPLETRNHMSGVLYVGLPETTLEDILGPELVQLFVSNVAVGYEKTGLIEHIRNLAYVDRTTGLSTFSGFLETYQRNSDASVPMLVVHTDIQRYRVIVDGIGDEKASAVLKKTGHRLSQAFPEALSIARKERDEFLILLRGYTDLGHQDIVARAEKAFQEPIKLEDGQLTLRLRLGIAFGADKQESAEQVTRYASIALNEVRQKGNANFAEFNPSMQEAAFERLRLVSLLTDEAENTKYSVHYQPIMHAKEGCIASFEALMRFQTPTGEFLNTAKMIQAAETSGLMSEIGAWMFKHAFFEFSQLQGLPTDVRLNVNLSPRQVHASRIYKDIEEAAAAAELPLNRVIFEVTEGLFLNNDQTAMDLLTWLRSQGASVVIDDFGTGYSSLSYLRKLPVNGIKIDRSFIMNMDQDADALAVVKSIIGIAQALDLKITAEGVETAGQRQIMQKLHCDFLQGYFFAKPLNPDDLKRFVQDAAVPGIANG